MRLYRRGGVGWETIIGEVQKGKGTCRTRPARASGQAGGRGFTIPRQIIHLPMQRDESEKGCHRLMVRGSDLRAPGLVDVLRPTRTMRATRVGSLTKVGRRPGTASTVSTGSTVYIARALPRLCATVTCTGGAQAAGSAGRACCRHGHRKTWTHHLVTHILLAGRAKIWVIIHTVRYCILR